MTDKHELVRAFNDYMIASIEQVSYVCPNSIISNNKDFMKSYIKKSPDKIIDLFVLYVLKDKEKIDRGDDEYFLREQRYEDVIGGDKSLLSKFFEFKDIWLGLTESNKHAVRTMMQTLSNIALQYFIIQDHNKEYN